MSDTVGADLLVGTWFHLHEEDSGSAMTLVRQGADLPPSRGRLVLTLRADGSAAVGAPGPDDRQRDAAGGWELAGDVLSLDTSSYAGRYQLVTASAERLVIRRCD